MRRAWIVLGALAVILTGCRAESVTLLRISPDGTATVVSEFAFDEEALAVIGDQNDTPDDVLRALSGYIDPSALPIAAAGVEPEQFTRGDLQGIRVTITGLDPGEVAVQLSSGDSIIDDITLAVGDGRLAMAGHTREIADFDRARLLSLVPGNLPDLLAVVLQVEVPGTVTAHNADRVLDGGVLQWDLLPAITDGEEVLVAVEATVDPGFQFVDLEGRPFSDQAAGTEDPSPTAWWVAVVPFLLAGAISWFIISRLRRRRLPEIEGFTPKG
jgi:hypothetical protein